MTYETTGAQRIRSHPSEYLKQDDDGLSPNALVRELVALSAIECFLSDYASSISVELTGPRSATLRDTGRGMRLEPDPGKEIGHAEEALTHVYPVGIDDATFMAVLQEWTWAEKGSLGPVVANALSESLVMTTHRNGEAWSQRFEKGVSMGPAERAEPVQDTGTCIELTADPTIFGDVLLDADALRRSFDVLRSRLRRLDLQLGASA